ncbi:hypothetical protein ACFVKB_41435 [Rhodococcus sp. NPDC127530]|uniref:hypothetical protein n=1 Tax=unclassified Rhodococcus (in: high G+C Gram-positive bacteria) TaxID=192944 RepID=UPI003644219F
MEISNYVQPVRIEQVHSDSGALNDVESWCATPELRRWMDLFRFREDFVSKLGTPGNAGKEECRLGSTA